METEKGTLKHIYSKYYGGDLKKIKIAFQRKFILFGGTLLLASLLMLALFALVADFTPSPELAAADQRMKALKLWQERQTPAYVPVQRDTELWRSVRLPPAFVVEELLRDQLKIPLGATPKEIERIVADWYQKAQKDAFFGPDPEAHRDLLAREKTLLKVESGRTASDLSEEELLPTPKNVLAVVVEFAPPGGSEEITRSYPVDPSDPSLGCTVITDNFTSLGIGDEGALRVCRQILRKQMLA